MDEMERRLKRDADAIDGSVSPELEARIAASLRAVEPARREAPAAPRYGDLRFWLFSSLTGVAAVLLVVVALNRPAGTIDEEPLPELVDLGLPPATETGVGPVPLSVKPAEFTGPLEGELAAFKADLEKAREALEDDLRFTF